MFAAVPSTVALAVAPVRGAIYRGSGVQYFNNHKCLNGPGLNCYELDPGRQKFSFQVSPNGKLLEQFVGGFNCRCACREGGMSINKMIPIKRGSFRRPAPCREQLHLQDHADGPFHGPWQDSLHQIPGHRDAAVALRHARDRHGTRALSRTHLVGL